MHYRRIRASHPPVLFELQLKGVFAHLAGRRDIVFPPASLMPRMRDYVQAMLLAGNCLPRVQHIAMLLERFDRMVRLSSDGKPFIYKKKDTLSLLFDVSAVQSEMHIGSPVELVIGYTHTMMGFLLFNACPATIGMIGLGGGSLPKYCFHYLPHTALQVAESNPHVIALRDYFCIPQNDARFQVLCEDGASFVADASDRFDVLLVDGFDKMGQPAQLCSQRFYDDCYNALVPDGIMVVNLLGDTADTQVWLDRIHRSFDDAVTTVDALGSLNKIVFACKGRILAQPEHVLLGRLEALEAQHPVSLRLTAQSILQQRRQNVPAGLRT